MITKILLPFTKTFTGETHEEVDKQIQEFLEKKNGKTTKKKENGQTSTATEKLTKKISKSQGRSSI